MSADPSDLAFGEEDTELASTGSDDAHRAVVDAEKRAQEARVDSMMQRWSIPPKQPARAGERREFVVRAANLEIGPEAIERASRPKAELTPEQLQLRETIGQRLFYEFSRELAGLATHLGVRVFEEGTQDELRLLEKVFDQAAPTWMAERQRQGGGLLGGAAFGELFKKKDPKTYRMMTEGWNPTFLPSTSMEARNASAARPPTDEDKVIIKKRTPVRPTPAPVGLGPLESDSTDEELVALPPSDRAHTGRKTVVRVAPLQAPDAGPAPAPAQPESTKKMIAVGVIAALVVAGGALWLFFLRDDGTRSAAPAETVTTTRTQVVTVVKTVEVPGSAPPRDASPSTTPPPPTSDASNAAHPPTVNTSASPIPIVKSAPPQPTPSAPTPTPTPTPTSPYSTKFGEKKP